MTAAPSAVEAALRREIARLEAENRQLRDRIAALRGSRLELADLMKQEACRCSSA